MRIEITDKLLPFSHLPGTTCVLTNSSYSLEIFPALIRVKDLNSASLSLLNEITLDIEGPVQDFTVIHDLEKCALKVLGTSAEGYFRYIIKMGENKQLIFFTEKSPVNGILFSSNTWISSQAFLRSGEVTVVSSKEAKEINEICLPSVEKLFLGNHKQQDWELVRRRLSFTEIFPVWFRLGQLVSLSQSKKLTGTALLLNECKQAIDANAPDKILLKFKKIFLAGFEGILSPRLKDTEFQGIKYQGKDITIPEDASALPLLTEGFKLIRSLFIEEVDQVIHILPQLPPEFHCGHLLNVNCGKKGMLSIEWTKKSMRRMTFTALENQKIIFTFSNHEKNCRLRSTFKEKGIAYIPGSQIDVVAGQNYWFDNFQR